VYKDRDVERIVEVIKEVIVEKEVIKEVLVEKEVVKEVFAEVLCALRVSCVCVVEGQCVLRAVSVVCVCVMCVWCACVM